jgi:hypothetical protein
MEHTFRVSHTIHARATLVCSITLCLTLVQASPTKVKSEREMLTKQTTVALPNTVTAIQYNIHLPNGCL